MSQKQKEANEAKEKKELNDYAQLVAEDAAKYQNQLNEAQKEKEEKTHFDGLDEEAMVQLGQKNIGKSKQKPLHLAQTKSKSNTDEDQIENNELLQTLSKAGLTDDQIQYLSQMTNSNEAPDINLLNQLNQLAGESTDAAATTSTATDATSNNDDMKQYNENIAIAADEIINENSLPTSDEAVQLKSSTKHKLSISEEVPLDIKQKEDLIQSATSANQAVGIDSE